jgi:alkylation response protein AidB-like acyl-CoA dehydrogenase
MTSAIDAEVLAMTLDAVQRFAADALPEKLLLDLDADEEFPVKLVRDLCGETIGIQLLFIPEEYGGMGGGAFDVYRVCEAMARVDLGIATGVLATFLGSDPIRVGGTPEQQAHWMSRLAEEGLLMAYAATEPLAGSDLGALKTAKQWISNGGFADLYSVLALAPGGPSWFLVEAGTEGLSHGKPEDKHGIRDSNTAAVMLDNVYVPADQLLGGVEGQGLAQAQRVFGYTRLMVAAFGLGCGCEAMERAIEYSKERVQAGTAARIDSGEGSLNTEGAIAKYFSSEAGNAAAEAAIQAFGGYGYTREYIVEKIKRDVRITTIYEGTSEIMEMTIARDRWQWHLKTRGDYYHALAREMEQLHTEHPTVGAATSALALHAMAEMLERCRIGRLTRNQHVLFRLGELIAWTECAASLSRRAANAVDNRLDEKADQRYAADTLCAMARILARQAAAKIAGEGLPIVVGAEPGEPTGLSDAIDLNSIHKAQTGLLADMNTVADGLYGRKEN